MNNIGRYDRLIRVVIALTLFGLYFSKIIQGTYSEMLLAGGGILLFTALRKCCPVYAILGFGTCQNKHKNQEPIIKTKNLKFRTKK